MNVDARSLFRVSERPVNITSKSVSLPPNIPDLARFPDSPGGFACVISNLANDFRFIFIRFR